ncbi:MAG: phosphoribosylglycinamide formyltransferase [Bacteroidetes bacterium]|nr:phosphoribosylglycinamide formyltransferase [Bacteroidota bacterium]
MIRLAIFASGSGTNAENIVRYFRDHSTISVTCILTNNPKAGVTERAERLGIPYMVFTREQFLHSSTVLDHLSGMEIDYLILAGFLWLIPQRYLAAFPDRIINIHPALLPAYGGKGMYGMNVHIAVKENGEKETGISIHFVNERYDEGKIIFQAGCPVEETDAPEDIAHRVHQLEYMHYARVIEEVISKQKGFSGV